MYSLLRQLGRKKSLLWFNGPNGGAAACCGAWRAWQGTKEVMVIHCLAPDVLTLSCLWIQLVQDKRVRFSAHLSLTIIQFTAHAILISNTHSQQAYICKSYKSPVAMGERRSSRWGNTGSCSCGPVHRRFGSIWSLSLRAKQYGEFGSRTERLSRPF